MSRKGNINAYTCKHGHRTITRDKDEGVTPFIIGCHACGRDAQSSFYQVDQSLTPSHEWYAPSLKAAKRLDRKYPGALRHVQQGGLMLRRIGSTNPVA